MRVRLLTAALLLLLAVSATAQRPIFEPDDFIDPATFGGPLFISRLIVGGVSNHADHYRPIAGDEPRDEERSGEHGRIDEIVGIEDGPLGRRGEGQKQQERGGEEADAHHFTTLTVKGLFLRRLALTISGSTSVGA